MNKEESKKCPFCAEEIKKEAIVCKHCSKDLKDNKSDKKKKKGNPVGLGCLIIIICGIVIFALVGSSDDSTSTQNYPPAYQLAAIQTSQQTGYSTPSQEMINEFDSYLNKLVIKCKENNKTTISDYVVKSQKLLKDDGINLQLSEIISSINDSIPDSMAGSMSCAEIATAFVVLTVSE